MKSKWIYFLSLFIVFSAFSQDDKTDERTIEVILGIDKIIKFDFIASPRVQIGNQTIVAYEIFPRKKEMGLKYASLF